jgi:flap endonuclease-1
MDALTFRSPKLLRRMTFAIGQKQPIMEIDLEKVLRGLDLTYEQFVDLCILCGCDYCSSIKKVGAKTALKYIKQFGSLERVVDYLRREKNIELPADWRPQRIPMRLSKKLEERTYSSRAEALASGVRNCWNQRFAL